MSFNDPSAGPQAPPSSPQSPQAPQAPQSPSGAIAPAAAGTPPLSSVGRRFGSYALEFVLAIVTLGIGWLIWTLIILGRGQTPAKQILNMRVVDTATGQVASYGKMFVREFLLKGLLMSIVVSITFGLGLILYFWLTWDDKNQELWDKMVSTVVVDDPNDSLAPA